MELKSIQVSILLIQLVGIILNLVALFVKKVADPVNHWFSIIILTTIMTLSIKSWYQDKVTES